MGATMTAPPPAEPKQPSTARAILLGGLIVGTLDITDAIVFFGITRNVRPYRIFQSVASGLLGRASYSGGMKTVVLGAFLHLFIAFCVATTYILVSKKFVGLRKHWVVCGLLYGVLVYCFMYRVVLPLSLSAPVAFSWLGFSNAVLIHMLGVGLPNAWVAQKELGK
ncbi:MAG: hypothetical protein M1453_01025 [Acidobacteria bacterium]|nr:hypothetical protein [Acidobacteriota bacterium]MCL5286567.1 hypothetical protein [Acidobacteriota bacterium]